MLLQAPLGFLRPRRPDREFLHTLSDAGMPTPQRTVRVCALRQVAKSVPTGAVAEGVRSPKRIDIALTGFIVDHPDARILVDPGVCADVQRRAVAQLPAVLRPGVQPPSGVVTTATALRELADGRGTDFALPTHLHWDHICGLLDLPGVPAHVHESELQWISAGRVAPVGGVRDALQDRPVSTYTLDGPPVATFERSHDLFGDGAVILIDLAGHTPGSVGVLAHTDAGWLLLAGDAVWHSLQITHIRQKASYPGGLADVDRVATFRTVHRLYAIADRIHVIPTHDHQASSTLLGRTCRPDSGSLRR